MSDTRASSAPEGAMREPREQPARQPLARQPLAPLRADLKLAVHPPAQLDELVQAALSVLERTGIKVLSPKALDLLSRHGAIVDRDRQTARMAPELVSGALSTAPRSFLLASRDASCDLDLSIRQTYCTSDGCGIEVVDFETGRRRTSTKADLAAITRIQDYLGSLAFWWPTVGATDCGETAQLHELDAGFSNTSKHLQGMVQGERLARHAVAMAAAVAGGPATLRRRPVMSDLVCTVSPLVVDRDGIEAALVFAEAGVPVCFCSMPTLGTTAPADIAGAVVLGLAEVAAAAAIIQLARPGAPVIGSVLREWADPRTGHSVQLPLDARCMSLATELVHHLGLPCLAGYGGTDAESAATWQAGVETTYDLAMAVLDEAELAAGLGLTDAFRRFSLEKLLLDDDLYHRVRHALLDVDFDELGKVLDVIDEVGAGGHFLAHRHTRDRMRQVMSPTIAHELGDAGRYRDPVDVARARGLRIVEDYEPEPLADDVQDELRRVLASADRAEGS